MDIKDTKTVYIDRVAYVFDYIDNDISFYADPKLSKKRIDFTPTDPDFPEEPAECIWDKVETKPENVFKILKEVNGFVSKVLGKYKPYYFTYSTFDKDRVNLYTRYAEKICKKYGYYFEVKHGEYVTRFRFWKTN